MDSMYLAEKRAWTPCCLSQGEPTVCSCTQRCFSRPHTQCLAPAGQSCGNGARANCPKCDSDDIHCIHTLRRAGLIKIIEHEEYAEEASKKIPSWSVSNVITVHTAFPFKIGRISEERSVRVMWVFRHRNIERGGQQFPFKLERIQRKRRLRVTWVFWHRNMRTFPFKLERIQRKRSLRVTWDVVSNSA